LLFIKEIFLLHESIQDSEFSFGSQRKQVFLLTGVELDCLFIDDLDIDLVVIEGLLEFRTIVVFVRLCGKDVEVDELFGVH
jgi:hypothetical protein